MVEHQTQNGGVLGLIPTGGTVSCPWTRHINATLKPRKRWIRPDMTEKSLTGMLNIDWYVKHHTKQN